MNPGPLAPQAKSLNNRPLLLPIIIIRAGTLSPLLVWYKRSRQSLKSHVATLLRTLENHKSKQVRQETAEDGMAGLQSKGPLTIRRTLLPTCLVNFSTFAFLLNFSFIKQRNHQSFMYRGRICITIINNRDFYVHQGISLKEYIGISILSYTILFPPVIHNFLLIYYSLPCYTRAL